jgi:hypothetical protein
LFEYERVWAGQRDANGRSGTITSHSARYVHRPQWLDPQQ